jgi:hypothetical protein
LAGAAVSDFEKLGKLYLGRLFDSDRGEATDVPLLYDSKDLTTHAVCVGMTGSGKTGLCVSLLEEAAIDGIPALCIDPKGDVGNLLLTFPELRPRDFEPWVDPSEAGRKGRTVAEHAEAVAALWRDGLTAWGQDGARIARLRDAVDMAIYTPGSSAGLPLRVIESFDPPAPDASGDAEREQIMAIVSSLLALLGIDPDPVNSREHILLSSLLAHAFARGESLTLGELVRAISEPPFAQIGVMDAETFYPSAERQKLAMRINGLLASPGFSAWLRGDPLDIQRLLWTETGKPRIAILSIAHLSEPERMFFVSLLLTRVVSWMRAQPGTSSLRAILYMDEVFGFLPPVAEPPSKRPLLTLLKQARAYGLGVVLATQNPVDLDYKALSNCGSWFLGRLQTERDVDRVVEGLQGAASAAGQRLDRNEIERLLAGLRSRVFLLNNVHESEPVLFHSRWAMSYLRGPLTRREIELLTPARAEPASERSETSPTEGPPAISSPRPVVPVGIGEVFLGDQPGRYRPHLMAEVTLHYVLSSHGLDGWEERVVVAPLGHGPAWDSGTLLDPAEVRIFEDEPAQSQFVAPPAGSVSEARFRSYAKQLKSHAYQLCAKTLWRCEALGLVSGPKESRADFSARAQLAARERRDAAVMDIQSGLQKKVQRLEDRLARAKDRLERERGQYEQQKVQTGISLGATVLDAILGRRAVGRATTAARGAGRVASERQDIERAEKELESLQAMRAELEAEAAEQVRTLQRESALDQPEIEAVIVRPRKADIEVTSLRLAWKRD